MEEEQRTIDIASSRKVIINRTEKSPEATFFCSSSEATAGHDVGGRLLCGAAAVGISACQALL